MGDTDSIGNYFGDIDCDDLAFLNLAKKHKLDI